MTRGSNNTAIQAIYLNAIRGSETLDHEFQRRVHRVARATRDEDLGAALAKRTDTLPEIDDDLGKWSSARVQSAWFARPGRDMAAAIAKLSREKRITVLEVISALPDLPPEIYGICARRNAVRVALPLVSNNSANQEHRVAAAQTLARSYSSMSYARQGALIGALSSCEQKVVDAFVSAAVDLLTIAKAISAVSVISAASLQHVYNIVTAKLRTVPKLHKQAEAETGSSSASRRSWSQSLYDINNLLRDVDSVLRQAPLMAKRADVDRAGLFSELDALRTMFESSTIDQRQRAEFLKTVARFTTQLDASNPVDPTSGPAAEIRCASSEERLHELVDELIAGDKLDRPCAVAVLTNSYANAAVALKALHAFGYGEVSKFLEARHRDVNLQAKAVILAHGVYRTPDDVIERFAAPATPAELWTELVSLHGRRHTEHGSFQIPNELFHSKFAKVDIIPKLPLHVFAHPDLPGWLATGFVQYLAQELTTQAAWDGFEVLAPKHLGSVSQVVRAAKVTVRKEQDDSANS
jgi:hypothetical protein